MVAMERQQEVIGGGSIRVIQMALSDPERRDTRAKFFFRADLLNDVRTVWPRTTKFGRKHVWGGCISTVSNAPTARGRGRSAPQFLEFPSIHAFTL